ncbi:hypothetical protein M405DRAFT_837808 [Rhizopogon salebrosus TDB-379]|nr:hypothetical protein M405DRAFT_837808 [Rhizopogon salebrosus TDB-379]
MYGKWIITPPPPLPLCVEAGGGTAFPPHGKRAARKARPSDKISLRHPECIPAELAPIIPLHEPYHFDEAERPIKYGHKFQLAYHVPIIPPHEPYHFDEAERPIKYGHKSQFAYHGTPAATTANRHASTYDLDDEPPASPLRERVGLPSPNTSRPSSPSNLGACAEGLSTPKGRTNRDEGNSHSKDYEDDDERSPSPIYFAKRCSNQLSVLEMGCVGGGDGIELSHPETWEEG